MVDLRGGPAPFLVNIELQTPSVPPEFASVPLREAEREFDRVVTDVNKVISSKRTNNCSDPSVLSTFSQHQTQHGDSEQTALFCGSTILDFCQYADISKLILAVNDIYTFFSTLKNTKSLLY